MRVSDPAIGTALILFGGWVLFYTRTFPTLDEGYPGPSLFPNVLAVLFILAGLGLILQGVRKGQKYFMFDPGQLDRAGVVNILLILVSALAYIFFSDYLGFLVISPLLLLVTMKWLKVGWLWSVVLSVGVTLGIYLLFAKALLVPLPWGLWGW